MLTWRAFPEESGVDAGAYLTIPSLAAAGIHAAFTTRLGGWSSPPYESLNLSYASGDDPALVRRNRARVLAAVGAEVADWTGGHQVHGARVARIGAAERGAGAFEAGTTIAGTDALWTDEPGIALAVLGADCVPVLLADRQRGIVGVAHAGWRGLCAGVIEATVGAVEPASSLLAVIGPSIGPCCYEVGGEVAAAAREAFPDGVVHDGARPRLDLWTGAAVALRRAGIEALWMVSLCTRCEPHRFFSHRAGAPGRQGLVVSLTG